jgi:Fe-S cluster assembly protein SufD
VFQGKIYVAEGAQKTDGYQLSRALLLSDQAEMDAKPELEIYADDVKCSHGSTIGDLDEEAMFYLRSRGLNETEARALLIEAFVGALFDEIPVEEWQAIFRAEMEGWQA